MDVSTAAPVLGAPMHVTFDCLDPERLADFWTALTGQTVAHREGPFVFLAGPTRDVTAFAFQKVDAPTPGKPRMHLDFRTTDLAGAAARVQELGGELIAEHAEMGARWQVAADPEGNCFCLVEVSG